MTVQNGIALSKYFLNVVRRQLYDAQTPLLNKKKFRFLSGNKIAHKKGIKFLILYTFQFSLNRRLSCIQTSSQKWLLKASKVYIYSKITFSV